jgi:hypothetical protein
MNPILRWKKKKTVGRIAIALITNERVKLLGISTERAIKV